MLTEQNTIEYVRGLMDIDILDWQVQLRPEAALAYSLLTEDYNDYSSANAARLVEAVNAAIPPMQFGEGNPNNGHSHHHFKVGRESSMVLYLEVSKGYLPKDFDYKALTHRLEAEGALALADEADVVEDEPSGYVFRWWWD
jgi:hypothetical protein